MAKTSKVGAKNSATSKSASKSKASSKSPAVNGDQLIAYYRDMLNIRRFEEKAGQLYGMGLIGGFCHLYIGQEAVVVGMTQSGTDDDSVITSYRDHGHMLACGMDPKGVMAELTGRRGGYSKGKGGSMHMFSREKKFFGGHGIVGAQIPLGTGLAFAHKYKEDNGVCHAYMGDGAVNQGQVFESFNMAALWDLPVVYVIENNKYGMGTSIERASSNVELSERGNAHDIQGQSINGMDVLDVVEKGGAALEHARSGKGPMILEMKTYRYRGHSMSDPAKYRSKEEVQKMRKESDPIDNLRHTILEGGFATEDQLKDIDKEIKSIVTAAAEYAQQSPEPDELELYTDILKEA